MPPPQPLSAISARAKRNFAAIVTRKARGLSCPVPLADRPDCVARVLAEPLATKLGGTVVVDNRLDSWASQHLPRPGLVSPIAGIE